MYPVKIQGINAFTITLTVLLLAANSPLHSQNIVDSQKAREEIFRARTKQFSEIVDRFNYKTDFDGNPVNPEFMAKMPRGKMISMLFDLKDQRLETSNKNYSGDYIKTKDLFIKDVCQKNLLIDKNSPAIIAEARTRVIYKGEPHSISLFLNRETVGKTSSKWVLLSAKGDIFDIFKKDSSMIRFIPPASHETDFMNLKRAIEDADHLQDYASRDYEPDFLSIFFYGIKSGQIKYEYVEEVVYHIIDIQGWYIKVKEFNRNELNSGWLITDVTKNKLSFPEFLKSLK